MVEQLDLDAWRQRRKYLKRLFRQETVLIWHSAVSVI